MVEGEILIGGLSEGVSLWTHREPSGIVSTSLWTHRETRGVVLSLEMDLESSGIELVYVCVCEGNEGRLGCGFILLYSEFYLTSILLVLCLCTIFYILFLVFYLLWLNPICYIRYCILHLLYSILYMYILYIWHVLDSKFHILYMLHIWTSILLLPSLFLIYDYFYYLKQ